MQAASQARRIAEINVTPLIDIVMVLLIVFIVMVPMADRAHAALIPRVTNELPSGTPAPVVLIGPQGLCTFGGRTLAPQELVAAIRDEVKRQPIDRRRVTLRIDGALPVQRAVEVMDLLKVAGDQAERENRREPGLAGQTFEPLKVATVLKQ